MTVDHIAAARSNDKATHRSKPPAIWRMPILLGALTVFGLLAALLGTGIWHLLSWIAIAVPLLVIAWYVCKTVRPAR